MNKILFPLFVVFALVLTACAGVNTPLGSTGGTQPTQVVLPTAAPAQPTQPAPTQPAPMPTATAVPVQPTAVQPTVSVPTGGLQTYSYTPGGEGFGKWATDVVHPSGYAQGTCGRIWQATNLENLAWVTMFCNWETSDPAPRLQWTHPTELTITDKGTVKFELWRDHGADNASNPSPYDVANVKNSPLGLGWFAQGYNAEICVNGSCQVLNGGGVFQIGFPKDFKGHYNISMTVNGGQAHFWQGEKITSTDNWPIP